MSVKQLGVIGVLGAGWFIVAALVLNVVDAEYSRVHDPMSNYANGEYGWLMQSAFLGAGIGAVANAVGLRKSLDPGKRVTASIVYLLIAGGGYFMAIATTDPLHIIGSLMVFFSLLAAVWLLRGVFRRDPAWSHLGRIQTWFAMAYTATMAVLFSTPMDGPTGLTQRIFVSVMMLWWIFVGWNIRQHDSTTQATEDQTTYT